MKSATSNLNFYFMAALLARVADAILLPVYKNPPVLHEETDQDSLIAVTRQKAESILVQAMAEKLPSAQFVCTSACAVDAYKDQGPALQKFPFFTEEDGLLHINNGHQIVFIDALDGEGNLAKGIENKSPLGMTVGVWGWGEIQAVYTYLPVTRRFLFADETMPTSDKFVDDQYRVCVGADTRERRRNGIGLSMDLIHLNSAPYHCVEQRQSHVSDGSLLGVFPVVGPQTHTILGVQESRCAAHSVDALLFGRGNGLCANTRVSAFGQTRPPCPSRYWPLAYLVDRVGGVARRLDGTDARSATSEEGVVLAHSPREAYQVRKFCGAIPA